MKDFTSVLNDPDDLDPDDELDEEEEEFDPLGFVRCDHGQKII